MNQINSKNNIGDGDDEYVVIGKNKVNVNLNVYISIHIILYIFMLLRYYCY